jgi:hypothetical protein
MNMNLNRSIKTTLLGGALVLAGACTDDFKRINTPPNSAARVDPGFVVANVQRNASFDKIDLVPGVLMFGNWVQHWGNQNAGFTTAHYLGIPNYDDGIWSNHYAYIRDLNMAENDLLGGQTDAVESRSRIGTIRVMKAMIFERLTALVGDIPYSEAAATPDKVTAQPVFETQESIYPKLIVALDEAAALITPGDVTFGNQDFYFNGDPDKWKKFANGLKLRTAMRMKYANPAAAQAGVTAAMAGPLASSLADAAYVATEAGNRNTAHRIWQRSDLDKTNAPMMGETLVSTLLAKNDPRLPLIADPTPNSKATATPIYRGVPAALSGAQYSSLITADYSYPSSKTYLNPALAVPSTVFTWAEVAFLKAEAALEGWGATEAQAQQFYQEGIRAAMSRPPFNLTAEASMVHARGRYPHVHQGRKARKIMTHKWIELFETLTKPSSKGGARRYPRLQPGQTGRNGRHIPAGKVNPQNQWNGPERSQLREGRVPAQGPDLYTTRVWIDKRYV